MRRPPNNMKCELLQLFLFPALGTSALLDPGSGSGVGVGSGFRIRVRVWIHQPGWIRTRSGAGSGSGSGQEALFTDIPFICGILYGGPDSDPDLCPGAGSGSRSAGPIWFGSGPGLGPGPDSCLDPDLRGGEGEVRLTMTQY